jgi:hypothetical protein
METSPEDLSGSKSHFHEETRAVLQAEIHDHLVRHSANRCLLGSFLERMTSFQEIGNELPGTSFCEALVWANRVTNFPWLPFAWPIENPCPLPPSEQNELMPKRLLPVVLTRIARPLAQSDLLLLNFPGHFGSASSPTL